MDKEIKREGVREYRLTQSEFNGLLMECILLLALLAGVVSGWLPRLEPFRNRLPRPIWDVIGFSVIGVGLYPLLNAQLRASGHTAIRWARHLSLSLLGGMVAAGLRWLLQAIL